MSTPVLEGNYSACLSFDYMIHGKTTDILRVDMTDSTGKKIRFYLLQIADVIYSKINWFPH